MPNVAVHSQAIEMNMHSTTLVSINHALNFGLWLYQALLNCTIHELMKKLVTDTLHVAIWCSSYKTDSISLPLSSTTTTTTRTEKDEEENPQVNLAGRGQGQCGGEVLKKQFPSSSPQYSTLEPGSTTSQVVMDAN